MDLLYLAVREFLSNVFYSFARRKLVSHASVTVVRLLLTLLRLVNI